MRIEEYITILAMLNNMQKLPWQQRGFGLIEVLISVVVLSLGLFGLASLQNHSIQAIQEGENLVTAAMIAEEMAKRMMSNQYITAQGRTGYLAIDLANAVNGAGGVEPWAAGVQTANPNIANCYPANNTLSCYNPGATVGNTSDHIQALQNMQLMDQVEMRLLAWNVLPQGEIMICFDSATAFTGWSCNNVASRITARQENVYTIKVQWNNIFSNTTQMYALQFTAECNNSDTAQCT